MRTMQRVVLTAAMAFWVFAGAACGLRAQDAGPKGGVVSAQEIEALKPLALDDLRKDLSEGGERPSRQDVLGAFGQCKFRVIALGKLGSGVLMEYDDPAGGPNAGSYSVYLRRNGRYARIAEGGGFGPYVLTSSVGGIPDLAFGSTSGVCTEIFVRLRYAGASYKIDACVQNVRKGDSDDCSAEACDDARKLPTFPMPEGAPEE